MTSSNTIEIFDRNLLRKKRGQALKNFAAYDFLFDWAGKQTIDRLQDVKREYGNALIIGARQSKHFMQAVSNLPGAPNVLQLDICTTSPPQNSAPDHNAFDKNAKDQNPPYICADEDFLPIREQSLDLALSTLNWHNVNDLPGALLQTRRALKPDGLFIGSMLGGETLFELRQCLQDAEVNISGGLSPRIHPFADKQDMGALMQRAGYALPVIDSDIITVTYKSAFDLFRDLRGMGETNALIQRTKTIPPKALFFEAAKLYQDRFAESDGRIIASFEVIFLLGWAPHESQQKPLKPGSAKTRLSDALGTEETKL